MVVAQGNGGRGKLTGLPRAHGLEWANRNPLPAGQGVVEVGYDAAGPRQRSLAAHPCRALTACSVPSAHMSGPGAFRACAQDGNLVQVVGRGSAAD